MNSSNLSYLNRLLVDYLGRNPAGGPLYKWFHSRDPEMFLTIGRLGSAGAVQSEYTRMPMVDELRWVLGSWQAPESKPVWKMKYGEDVPYPTRGYYVPCSIPSDPLLEVGVEPNERITMYTIGLRKQQIEMQALGIMNSRRAARAAEKSHKEREADALLKQMWRDCEPKVPGAREALTS